MYIYHPSVTVPALANAILPRQAVTSTTVATSSGAPTGDCTGQYTGGTLAGAILGTFFGTILLGYFFSVIRAGDMRLRGGRETVIIEETKVRSGNGSRRSRRSRARSGSGSYNSGVRRPSRVHSQG